jgi:hypothetical protein
VAGSHAANAGETLIANITNIRAATDNNTRMRCFFMRTPPSARAEPVGPAS